MRFSFATSILALVAPILVSAAPVRRQVSQTDLLVLGFADVLEQLETSFYTQALLKFQESDFTAAGFSQVQVPIQQFKSIVNDETTHATVLESTITSLGGTPITGCQFSFGNALTNVATMAATARVVENVGVAAYLGAAHLVSDPVILTAAASILTVEARHQTILNVLSGTGTAIPSAFDIAFTPEEVVSIAGSFISGCDIGVTGNPALQITNTGIVAAGTTLTFQSTGITGNTNQLSCQMIVGDQASAIVLPFDACVVPSNINGPVAIFVTNDTQPLLNDVVNRATGTVVAGPTMAFIDAQPEALGELVLPNATNATVTANSTTTASASSVTQTISPGEASSIISSAAAQATSASSSAAQPSDTTSATSTSSAATTSATTPVGNVGAAPVANQVPGGQNNYVGPSPDGTVFVNGWTGPQAPA
ncbi:hypothetical protein JAAARDRAFT_28676 [Jaapia argillacea MUCL 33604]|uniref:Ferritin-like domain-containing protein n=1 Tax=Jaapia argillacea MUCL 33604 TaxID=933084 RepID=A0A067QD78_9AGAM|nr:hypothetical protein JAAARDRAFT_28676 [Jaapia argillacea MUCL 33604]